MIVDKKNFTYNIIRQESIAFGDQIWCKANNEYFAIQREGLLINSVQLHHLLWEIHIFYDLIPNLIHWNLNKNLNLNRPKFINFFNVCLIIMFFL